MEYERKQISKRNYTNAIFLCSCLFVFLFVSIRVVNAQVSPSLAVFPEKFEFPVSRSEVREEELRVTNTGDVPIPLRFRLVRWDAADEVGGINYFEQKEDSSFDIIQWISFSEADVILEAKETRKIPFTITVPANAEPGGKYGAIFVEPAFPDFYFAEGATRVLPKIGILLLLNIPTADLEGEIMGATSVEEFTISGRSNVLSQAASRVVSLFRAPLSAFAAEPAVSVDVFSKTPSDLVLRIKNNGIAHLRPHGRLSVHNTFGAKVAEAELAATTILPGKIRKFPIMLSQTNVPLLPSFAERQLALGRYRATVVLEGAGEEEPLVQTLSYWIFPWPGFLMLFLVSAPLVFTGWRLRNRFTGAVAALLSGVGAGKRK
ncbi:MAG: hypothetical protein A2806_02505 [Candidatus Terrybacteria bacterium RIFCSPHIGHO2_01_FULL_48_17]|uniref:Uncharacterized protein n=1 Tax=Candidatus Terrybacteria bacterium RIFCSPHIGHO2_01_FULL_48_17 TaxID=1802362 RepID=A0A1G2PHR2_9BACT|nr:MAG: hypothetical protein A2806_02505 [Candidatus Terrybacteria bacterium RIFCSPHIGHO2_01_FULL_48_17]OHA51860.1 MAG: hypothetical protein A3A30_01565 [Candidatus Terrybacteria bacterium RIFCSPLOWO2_01_FULL_48_14]